VFKLSRRIWLAAIAVAIVGAAAADAVSAPKAFAATISNCPATTTVTPFQRWGDTGSYVVAPGGAFEGSLTGWTVSGGAKLVNGNESSFVNSTKDKSSLYLPNGSTATSPSVCVTTNTPDLRLFVQNTGAASATLRVNMTYTNNTGQASTVTVASLTGGSAWAPTPQVYFLQNINSLVNSNGQTWVTFSFAPVGTNGHWQIDDFYVDPFKHG
jgi:hypothetical protein